MNDGAETTPNSDSHAEPEQGIAKNAITRWLDRLLKRPKLGKLLFGCYLGAFLLTILIYTIIGLFTGKFDEEILLLFVIGYPAGAIVIIKIIFLGYDAGMDFIGWEILVGYFAYLATGTMIGVLKHKKIWGRALLVFFFVLILLNLTYCVPAAVILGLDEIH